MVSVQPLRVVVADDFPVSLAGARALLSVDPSVIVVGEAADALQAVELVATERPNIAILDLQMPGLQGEDMIRRIRESSPETHVLVFSMRSDEESVAGCLLAGADGYVLKSDDAAELRRAVASVAQGLRHVSPALSASAIEAAEERILAREEDPIERLTAREREIFQLVAEGRTSREIGDRLGISPRTVENHRANVMKKLGMESQRDLLRFALRRMLPS